MSSGAAGFLPLSALMAAGRPAEHTVCFQAGRRIAWGDFAGQIGGIARALSLRPERRWLVHCDDPQAFAACLLAVLHCARRAVIAPGLQPAMLDALRPAYDAVLGDGGPSMIGVRGLAPATVRFEPLEPRGAVIELFTSGSSGEPKRVEKTLAQLENEARVLEATWGAALQGALVVGTVPHHHIYGLLFRLVWPLAAGRAFDTALCADPAQLLESLGRTGEAVLVSSPAHLTRLPQLIALEALKPLTRRIFSSGAPLPAAVGRQYAERLGAAPTEVYGSTESGGVAWREQDAGPGCDLWQPFPGIALRTDAQGALCVRSPYLADDGWLTLGDGAAFEPDGRFRLQGRLDRVVKVEGKRIALAELEQALRQHPRVADAAVVPLAGTRESLGAVVVLREATHPPRGELVASLREALLQRFERVLVPRQWRFAPQLPCDERGKVTAQLLQSLFERPLDDAPLS